MLNSGFIPEVVDASAINSQINSMQSSVNSINNSFSTINSRLTQLEKDISADVIKATETLPSSDIHQTPDTKPSYVPFTLNNDSSRYSYINLKIASFTIRPYRDDDPIVVPQQQVKIVKNSNSSVTIGILYDKNEINHDCCIGSHKNPSNYGIGTEQCSVRYVNNSLYFYFPYRVCKVSRNILSIEYY